MKTISLVAWIYCLATGAYGWFWFWLIVWLICDD